MTYGRRFALVFGAVAAVLVAACTPTARPAATGAPASEAPIKLVVGRGTGISMAHMVIAEDQGFFKANGIDGSVRQFSSNTDAVNAMLAGDIQGAVVSPNSLNTLVERGVDLKVLGVLSRNPRDQKVVAVRSVARPEDLKGKKIAVLAGTTSEMGMAFYLKKGGLTMADVEVVKADPPEIVALMSRGDADAFSLWEPFSANAVKIVDGAHIVAYSEDLGFTGQLMQAVSGKFLTERPEAGARLMRAYVQAEQFMQQNPDKTLEILARANKLEPAVARPLLDAAVIKLVVDQQMLDEIRLTAEWQAEVGQLKGIPNAAGAIDANYLRQVDASRVTARQ